MQDFADKIHRETLTKQNINGELKKKNIKTFWVVFSLAVFTVLFLMTVLFLSMLVDTRDFIFCLMWFLAGFICGYTTIRISSYIKSVIQQKQKTTVVTDWLVDIHEDTDVHNGMYHRHKNYTDFIFANYGRFRLYTDVYGDTNYTWSKTHAMSNQSVCNCSNIDDEFYLVITDDKNPKILQIYNQKLFVLK